jgi:hypothetical protein
MPLIGEHLKEVGIHCEVRLEETSLLTQRASERKVMASQWNLHEPCIRDASYGVYTPFGRWCPMWNWDSQDEAERPDERPDDLPDSIYRMADNWNVLRPQYQPHSPEDTALVEDVYEFLETEYWIIGAAAQVVIPKIYTANLGNVPIHGIQLAAWFSLEESFFRQE